MLDLYEELRSLIRALEDAGIDYALCGGLAMAVYSIPRATVDIDVMIEPESLDGVRKAAGGLGFTVEANPMSFAGGDVQIRRLSKIDPEEDEPLMLDLILVTPAVRETWDTRTRVEWEGGELRIVSREAHSAQVDPRECGRRGGYLEAEGEGRMKVDMSPSAVDARLRRVSQLRRLCLSLARAGARARGVAGAAAPGRDGFRPTGGAPDAGYRDVIKGGRT